MIKIMAIAAMAQFFSLSVVIAQAQSAPAEARATAAPMVEKYLIDGNLNEGEKALEAAIKANSSDDQARFGLGVLQFVRGVERLTQGLRTYGLRSHRQLTRMLGVPMLEFDETQAPKSVSADDLRKLMEAWLADLTRAEKTLSGVSDASVKLAIHVGQIHLDVNGDGKAADDEVLLGLDALLGGGSPTEAAEFVITFDRADVEWFRGYCHLLSAITEFVLAYDWTEWFERAGHLLFLNPKSPYEFLQRKNLTYQFDYDNIVDLVACVHEIRFPLKEPERMRNVLTHLESMITNSRRMWELVLAENDDDHEWIPSPKQTGVIPGVKVTDDMVRGWRIFLDEAQAILAGKKLIPFWRGTEPLGVNLRRVFTEPRRFDLVLWFQGTDAAPYLEKGSISSMETWEGIMRLFQGNFIGFAAWFN